jgi:SpoVK/Ycf46/Vps4 family AAA+-type ATPase
VGRNIVTLDRKSKQLLGITSGDIVEIEGTKKTAAIVWPARTEDEGKDIIRMDNLIRHNAGVNLGEKVTIRPSQFKEAQKVVLAPTQDVHIIASGYERILKKTFIGRPLTRGDNVWITVFGSGFIYRVVETNPRGIVKVTDFTQFLLKDEPIKGELEGVPKKSYDDVGGLKGQVDKVRELIELPMRHPELFRKLGIEPPKGVLLHGPPGTGKTLLAKAVANETQTHFISVSAPAIMCVGEDTPILTNPKGAKTAKSLFEEAKEKGKVIMDGKYEVVELGEPVSVYGLDDAMQVKKGKITHLTKLKAPTLRVKNNLGDEIIVSSNQPFAMLDAFGNLSWKTAGNLREGDYVACASELPEGKSFSFDLSDIKNNPKATVKRTVHHYHVRIFSGQPVHNAGFTSFPYSTSPDFMRLMGLMYSEGCLARDGLEFSNQDQTLKKEFNVLVKKLFGLEGTIKKDRVAVYSRTLRSLFIQVLGYPVGPKGNYHLPTWMFGLTKKETAGFIQGYFEGDGTVGLSGNEYPTIRLYAKAKTVLGDVNILLRKMGLFAKLTPWKTPLGLMHCLELLGSRSRELFVQQMDSTTPKFARLKKWIGQRKKMGDDLNVPPIGPLLQSVKKAKGLVYGKTLPEGPTERYISGRDPLTYRKLIEINGLMGHDPALQKIMSANVRWARIQSIQSEGEKELYDLSVEPFSNFLGGSSLMVLHNSKFVGEAEERVRQIFKEAEENAPSIIFFDEIDAIAPKREEVIGEVERRVVAQLLSLMDGMESRGNVVVIAATNRVNSLDEALRRPGRFDREIEIGVPDKEGRKEILQIHTRGMPLAKDVDLDHFAGITYGFVGADLTALAKESAMKALRRYMPEINLEDEQIPESVLERMEVQKKDFEDALREIQPSALREVIVEIPNVKWDDIGALDEVKAELKQAVEWPLKYPSAFIEMGIRPPRGVLLYGPPGTGKTLLAKAIATESQANFISIKGPELISKWIGESEKGIRQVFKKARQVAPVIVFFDEIDAIASIRGSGMGDSGVGERVVNQLLTELDGAESLKDVVFVAATNRPDLIDPGLMRPGRIDKVIEVKVPDEKAREAILKVHTRGVPLAKGVSIVDLAKHTSGYSGADLANLIREAALLALSESGMKSTLITKKHFDAVLSKVTASIPKEALEAYAEYRQSRNPDGPKPVRDGSTKNSWVT